MPKSEIGCKELRTVQHKLTIKCVDSSMMTMTQIWVSTREKVIKGIRVKSWRDWTGRTVWGLQWGVTESFAEKNDQVCAFGKRMEQKRSKKRLAAEKLLRRLVMVQTGGTETRTEMIENGFRLERRDTPWKHLQWNHCQHLGTERQRHKRQRALPK